MERGSYFGCITRFILVKENTMKKIITVAMVMAFVFSAGSVFAAEMHRR